MELEHARSIVDSAHEAFIAMDADGRIAYWNPQAVATFGWSAEEALGRELAETVIPPEHRDAHWRGLRHFLATGEGPMLDRRFEIDALHRAGHKFPVELTISAMEVDGRWTFNAFLHEITERRRSERVREELLARIEATARADELTGLPNRRAFEEELPREIARADRYPSPLSLVLIELARGEDSGAAHRDGPGDVLLRSAAVAWRASLQPLDFLARSGDAEFALLLPDCSLSDGLRVVERLRATAPEQQAICAGIACRGGEESAEALLGRAERALSDARRAGLDRVVPAD